MPIIDLRTRINKIYQPFLYERSRYLILYGGAGSGKSYFAAQKLILRMMGESPHTFVAVRKVGVTVRNSVFALLTGIISQWGLSHLFDTNKSDKTITYKPNGNVIICTGLDDPEKIKSITGANGLGVTGFWLEEPTELTLEDLTQIGLRLRGKLPNYKQIILSFNPISHLHWLKARFFDNAPESGKVMRYPRTTIVHSNYMDNEFIDDEYREELEALREIDESLYNVYCLGQWGVLKGVIYQPWPNGECPGTPDEVIYGLDFGFNNPTALVKIEIKDQACYLTELIYETKLTTEQLAERMKELEVGRNHCIYADAAEPDRIQQLCDAGFYVLPAAKGQGSVNAGIVFVKSKRIYTKPGNTNINKENGTYKWKVDKKTDQTLDEPLKFCDHSMDAIRYAIFTHLCKESGFEVVFL